MKDYKDQLVAIRIMLSKSDADVRMEGYDQLFNLWIKQEDQKEFIDQLIPIALEHDDLLRELEKRIDEIFIRDNITETYLRELHKHLASEVAKARQESIDKDTHNEIPIDGVEEINNEISTEEVEEINAEATTNATNTGDPLKGLLARFNEKNTPKFRSTLVSFALTLITIAFFAAILSISLSSQFGAWAALGFMVVALAFLLFILIGLLLERWGGK